MAASQPLDAATPVKPAGAPSRRRLVQGGIIGAAVVAVGAGALWLTRRLTGLPGRSEGGGLPQAWKYDLQALQQVDPALVKYQPVDRSGPGPEGLKREELAGRLARYFSAMSQPVLPTGLARAGGLLFVADARSRCVWQVEPEGGAIVGRLGGKGHFVVPSPYFDVAAAPDGRSVWVTNPGRHRVERYDLEGRLVEQFGRPGTAVEKFCGCCNPCSVSVLSDGKVVTGEKGLPRVKVYRPDGTLESVVAAPSQFAEQARTCAMGDCTTGGLDVKADGQDRVWVYDRLTEKVWCFARRAGQG